MKYLLVEKIAVDFWCLRRVMRYETGCTCDLLDKAIYKYYKNNDIYINKKIITIAELDQLIAVKESQIQKNKLYLESLKSREISFDAAILGEAIYVTIFTV
jgi:hypothetical protein